MDLRVVPLDNGRVTVVDRNDLDAGVLYTAPVELEYYDAIKDARRWAARHNAKNVIDKSTRLLAGETVEGLCIGSAGITKEFCENALREYTRILEKHQ